ncbi:unnamed protein product [Ostreobium quekettii]|uniref:Ubiquitin-like domain-containing protein n=1 Tax=Ostreobium quekettii TaxID=121088 RepID=A0A8S1J3G2_9CHLO|nr:unnamed protein product [Ostreobium quekettii]|eukprot:evm.model.scf_808.3 EVM.evm.TU.scf_808.3   scf_808:16613-18876(-)
MAPIALQIQSRSGKTIVEGGVTIDADATVDELKKALHAKKKKWHPSRQRLTLPAKPGQKTGDALMLGVRLAEYGLEDGSTVVLKDLGPQIAYIAVFFWEYFGPLAVYPLFYFFPKLLYPFHREPVVHSIVQTMALAFWTAHYAKRILETFFVHRFSKGTMPLFNLFKNCSYYWGFAAMVSYFVNHPLYTPPDVTAASLLLGGAVVCQVSNLYCHILQKNLRKPGEKGYKVPHGFLFEYITCANYTCETLAWVLFGFATKTVAAFLFATVGGLQMAQWAGDKHRRLVKMFDGKESRPLYPKRWRMIPFLY